MECISFTSVFSAVRFYFLFFTFLSSFQLGLRSMQCGMGFVKVLVQSEYHVAGYCWLYIQTFFFFKKKKAKRRKKSRKYLKLFRFCRRYRFHNLFQSENFSSAFERDRTRCDRFFRKKSQLPNLWDF